MSLFNELKRRNVFRVGIAYLVVGWLVAQVLQLVMQAFGTPDWVMKTVLDPSRDAELVKATTQAIAQPLAGAHQHSIRKIYTQ